MKHYIPLLLLAFCSLTGRAQQLFTQLDWNALRIDSVLPRYTEVVPLETDYTSYDYAVRVRYPEWAELTERETAVARRFDADIADTLCINTFVGVSRGRGLIDIDFIPIVRRQDKYWRLTSGKVEIVPTWKGKPRKASPSTRAAAENRWASNSVLATGKWVRITLTDDGIYHLTNSQLRSMGFSNPLNIRVYGYGGHQQDEYIQADTDWDDLSPVSLLPVSDGYLFHANGLTHWNGSRHIQNHYARTASYFVTEADSANPGISQLSSDNAAQASSSTSTDPTTFTAYVAYDPQEFAWYQGGWQLYESYDYASGNRRTYTLNLPTYAADEQAKLSVRFSANNNSETEVHAYFNSQEAGTFTVGAITSEYYFAREITKTYSVDAPLASNTVVLTTTAGQHARLNYLLLTYTGLLRLDATHPYVQFPGKGLPADICLQAAAGQEPQLWQLDDNRQPAYRIPTTEETTADGRRLFRATLDAQRSQRRYAAFDAAAYSSYPQPAVAGTVENQNLHATDSLDLVIITPASGIFDAQARRLADAHRDLDGLRAAVVRADHIYNEFSSGTPDATAYRRFMKMLYDRGLDNQTAPRYLLLFGDCAWDNRMLTSYWVTSDPDNFLLCYESENSYHDINCYIMEDYFGLLDDGEGRYLLSEKGDLGIGRLPVRTLKEATTVVDKILHYMSSEEAGVWKNIVCFLGDDGDRNLHEEMADLVASQVAEAHPELEVRKIIWDASTRESTASGYRYPQTKQIIKKQMNEGALMMNYTGHAATYTMSHEQVILLEDFKDFTVPRPPLWFTAACDVMPFDTQKENFGETALLHETGAAIAFYGTTRTVYATENSSLNQAYCEALFDTDELGRPNRLGDVGRLAKATVIEGGQTDINKLHYALLGDPALRLGGITNRIVLDSINGTAIDDLDDDFTLNAGAVARLAGHVADASGNPLETFAGTLAMRLYDSQSTIVCNKYDATARTAFSFKTYDKILYNGTDSIRAGRFALSCPIPLDIKYSNAPGRLLFYALSNDRRTEANGYSQSFLLGGTATELTDSIGPVIQGTLGGLDFEDGMTVSATPFFQATLEDESGINNSGNGVGHDLELIVDNDATRTYNLNEYFTLQTGTYRQGTVGYCLPALEAGEHKLTFRAWDMLNNSSKLQLSFNVDPSMPMNLTELAASPNPARTNTQFLLTHDRPGSTCTFTIEVFDFTGRVVWSQTTTGSSANGFKTIAWDLTTNTGAPVHSGVYLYRARVSTDESAEVTAARKLIINRSF